MWRKLLRTLSTDEGCRSTAKKIHNMAIQLAAEISDLTTSGENLKPEEVLIDLPLNKVVVRGGDILTRTDGGHVGTPNLFFDPERWSQAYEHQKQCGFVFTPRDRVPLVALASRIVFFEEFGLVMDEQADRAAKVTDTVRNSWIQIAREQGLCTPECGEALQANRTPLLPFQVDDIEYPNAWSREDPKARSSLADDLNINLPNGLPASFHQAALTALKALARFVDVVERNGTWTSTTALPEQQLQGRLREFLDGLQVPVAEGVEFGGGECDLVVAHHVVVENKVISDHIKDPFGSGPNFVWQARRYSFALCSRVVFVVLAYRPLDESAIPPLPSRIAVVPTPPSTDRCEIRVAIPWGSGVPSSAKRPT